MATITNIRQKSTRVRNLIAISAMVILSFCATVAFQGMRAYDQTVQEGKQNAERLARILADHVDLTFLGVDLSLRRAVERQYFNTLFGNDNMLEYTEQHFKVWLNETPQIVALAMIGEDGTVQVAAHKEGYEHWLDYHKTVVGQKLFNRMREAEDNEVFIGKHYTENNDSFILMSRRFNKLNGDFSGIVVGAIDPNYFVSFYDAIAMGKQKYMSLMLSNGSVLSASPTEDSSNDELSRAYLAQEKDALLQDNTAQTKVFSVGEQKKIVSLKRLKNVPIVLSTVLDSGDFLQAWYQSVMKDLIFIVLFVTFSSILSFFAIAMAKQIIRVEESEASAILASQAKSEFLANMSHELRTPLNAIIGFSEMINSGYFGPLNAKQKERIHDINLCGTHLLQLITDILEFSKGEAGKLELIEEVVDVHEIVSEGARIMSGKIRAKGINLVVAVEPGLPMLRGDKRKLRQVLINLLSNALKFTPENGAITVSVRIDHQQQMNLIVSDTGIGIAEEDIPKALSVFGQVHRNKSHEGTGLGLPLCKMYTELHEGTLLLTSKVGEGTTVRVILPPQRLLPRTE
jgi:signal transduction histidine kinase